VDRDDEVGIIIIIIIIIIIKTGTLKHIYVLFIF